MVTFFDLLNKRPYTNNTRESLMLSRVFLLVIIIFLDSLSDSVY